MYTRYAESQRWKVEEIDASEKSRRSTRCGDCAVSAHRPSSHPVVHPPTSASISCDRRCRVDLL
jgi:hypothetical protein